MITTQVVAELPCNKFFNEAVIVPRLVMFSSLWHGVGNTPLVPILKLLQPHKITQSSCEIHAKCEHRNPSGSIWDRLVCHEMTKNNVSDAFVTGGINDLCLSLAWAGTAAAPDNVSVAVLPGLNLGDCKLQLMQGSGANVILSYQQDAHRNSTRTCLEDHINKLENTSGVAYQKILPYGHPGEDGSNIVNGAPYDALVQEVNMEKHKWDVIVCGSQDKRLLQALRNAFPATVQIVGVDFSRNTFSESFSDDLLDIPGVKGVQITDAECYNMARCLVREEGLMVGPISGGVMSAVIKEIKEQTSGCTQKIMVILPDNLNNNCRDFLSVDWMVQKGYYPLEHMESLFWWYDMAVENINPPEILLTTSETPINVVWEAMKTSSMERCVVITAEEKRVFGVCTKECLVTKCTENSPIGNVCTKQFGLIDSKANFSELERLLRKYNWIVNVHRVPMYTGTTSTNTPTTTTEPVTGGPIFTNPTQLALQTSEDFIGAINMADFICYKRKVEKHHMKEYGIAMSDGVSSDIWVERFNEHLKNKKDIN